ncbi:hypothetical protein RSAG8_03776, partial [Rhizoctonia solani AG-8 WAC10335]
MLDSLNPWVDAGSPENRHPAPGVGARSWGQVLSAGSMPRVLDPGNGYAGPEGHRKTITFGPVTKGHNIIFEPVILLLLDGIGQGVFVGIMNLDELFAFNGAVIKVKPEFQETPVFVKHSHHGLHLVEHVPAPPHQLSGITTYWCHEAGIAGGGLHAVHCGAAGNYALSLTKDCTQYLLNHGDHHGIVLDNHYTTGLEDYPLVEIQLGKITGHLTEIEKKLKTQAMNILVHCVQLTNPLLLNEDVEQKKAQKVAEEEVLKTMPDIQSLTDEAVVDTGL